MTDLIRKWQEFLKTPRLGVVFNGHVDGIQTIELIEAIKRYQEKTGKIYLAGDQITGEPVDESDPNVLKFQEFLSVPNKISDKLYFGPKNGIANAEFVTAIKKFEELLANKIGSDAVIGQIWSGKINTTIEDVIDALGLIKTAQVSLNELNYEDWDNRPIYQTFVVGGDELNTAPSDSGNLKVSEILNQDDRILEMLTILNS